MWVGPGRSALSARALPPFRAPTRSSIDRNKGPGGPRGRFSNRLLPFSTVYLARTNQKSSANQSLGSSAVFSPFKNGENGGNGAASNRRRDSIKIHPALVA